MDSLTPDEENIASAARALCFTYHETQDQVLRDDVHLYVERLVALFLRKPNAEGPTWPVWAEEEGEARTLRGTLQFCIDQLKHGAPTEADKLRAALQERPSEGAA
jgi:hypothetical protein